MKWCNFEIFDFKTDIFFSLKIIISLFSHIFMYFPMNFRRQNTFSMQYIQKTFQNIFCHEQESKLFE